MSENRVCCNCRHNIRIKEVDGRIKCECEIDHSYIGYVACMNYKCDKWESDEEYWKEKKGDTK